MDLDQKPAEDTEPAVQPAQGPDRALDLSALIASLARLLARQAAREHLHRLSQPDTEDTPDES